MLWLDFETILMVWSFLFFILLKVEREKKRKEASLILSFHFRYICDVLSINNSKFGDYVDSILSHWDFE